MVRRRRSPAALIAALIAVAISVWMTRDDAPREAPASLEDRALSPVQTPTQSAEPDGLRARRSGENLDQIVPDATERAELVKTLDLIERGGPFPHKQDNTVFGNRERRLPQQPRGYYREYTVRTPGAPTRGARRVVRGEGGELYYTRDHYRTFVRIDTLGT